MSDRPVNDNATKIVAALNLIQDAEDILDGLYESAGKRGYVEARYRPGKVEILDRITKLELNELLGLLNHAKMEVMRLTPTGT